MKEAEAQMQSWALRERTLGQVPVETTLPGPRGGQEDSLGPHQVKAPHPGAQRWSSPPALEIQCREKLGPSQQRTCQSVSLDLELGATVSGGDLAGPNVGSGRLQGRESEAKWREGTQAGGKFPLSVRAGGWVPGSPSPHSEVLSTEWPSLHALLCLPMSSHFLFPLLIAHSFLTAQLKSWEREWVAQLTSFAQGTGQPVGCAEGAGTGRCQKI